MTKYECPYCKNIKFSTGFPNQTGGVHPQVCTNHGQAIVVMKVKL